MKVMPDQGLAGFSLIETLVALVILAAGILAVTTMFTESRRVLQESDRYNTAAELARQKLEEKTGASYRELTTKLQEPERIEDDVITGEDQRDGIVRSWRIERERPEPGIALIRVTTRWVQRGTARSVTMIALKADGRSS